MTTKVRLGIRSLNVLEMVRLLILMVAAGAVKASSSIDQVALTNVTRYATGDYFSLIGEFLYKIDTFVDSNTGHKEILTYVLYLVLLSYNLNPIALIH